MIYNTYIHKYVCDVICVLCSFRLSTDGIEISSRGNSLNLRPVFTIRYKYGVEMYVYAYVCGFAALVGVWGNSFKLFSM